MQRRLAENGALSFGGMGWAPEWWKTVRTEEQNGDKAN